MPGAVPDVKHLLELMTRAAGELKAAQKDAGEARAEAEALSKRLARTETDLMMEKARALALEDELEEARNATYVPLAPVPEPVDLPTPESTFIALPEDQTKVGIGDPGLLQGRIRSLEAELASEVLRRQTLEEKLRAAEEAAALVATSSSHTQELEEALSAAKAQLEASSDTVALDTATDRVAQLEQDLAAVRTRRDELNAELGKVEKERNTARSKVTELEAAAQTLRGELEAGHQRALKDASSRAAELEAQLAKEREKQQAVAQKVLEARGRVKDVEAELEAAKTGLARAEAQVKSGAEERQRSLKETRAAHGAASAGSRSG